MSGFLYIPDPADCRNRHAGENQVYRRKGIFINNWEEDLWREESDIAQLLEKHAKDSLQVQQRENFLRAVYRPVQLTRCFDGYVHNRDIIMLKWGGGLNPIYLAAKPLSLDEIGSFSDPCPVSGTEDSRICARSTFRIFRYDKDIPETTPLKFEELVFICTTDTENCLYLNSEINLMKKSRWAKHQDVDLVRQISGRALWKILFKDKRYRLESEEQYIPSNVDVVINHSQTNRHLALEKHNKVKTYLGVEWEISCHTYVNCYKAETEENIWQIRAPVDTEDCGCPLVMPGHNTSDPNCNEDAGADPT